MCPETTKNCSNGERIFCTKNCSNGEGRPVLVEKIEKKLLFGYYGGKCGNLEHKGFLSNEAQFKIYCELLSFLTFGICQRK